MKRIAITFMLTMTICLTACGNKAQTDGKNTTPEVSTEEKVEEAALSDESAAADDTDTNDNAESIDGDLSELESIGDVDVDKGLFDVTITVPKDFIGETTQEDIDKSIEENGYKSGTLNSDGSVTYVMTKDQHKEMMKGIKESIDQSLSEMIGSETTPNITDVQANDDYTSFTVTTKNAELDLAESFSVMTFYMYGGMYAIFNGETVDNIHVDYINAESGEVISSANSEDMGE